MRCALSNAQPLRNYLNRFSGDRQLENRRVAHDVSATGHNVLTYVPTFESYVAPLSLVAVYAGVVGSDFAASIGA